MSRKLIVYTPNFYSQPMEVVYDSSDGTEAAKALDEIFSRDYNPICDVKYVVVPDEIPNSEVLRFFNDIQVLDRESLMNEVDRLVRARRQAKMARKMANAALTAHKAKPRQKAAKRA